MNSSFRKQKEKASLLEDNDNEIIIENYLEQNGGFGLYQKYLMILFFLIEILVSFIMISPTFLFLEPEFECPKNLEQCTETINGCQYGQIKAQEKQTFTIIYDLYCKNRYLRNLSYSFLFLGSTIGNFLIGFLGDVLGRKKVLICIWLISSLAQIIICFQQNPYVILVANFVTGFFIWPALNYLLVILNEQNIQQKKALCSLLLMIGWSAGELLVVPLVYYFNDYKKMYLYFIAIPCLIINVGLLFIIESPLFYLTVGKEKKAKKVLEKIVKFNRKKNQQSEIQLTFSKQNNFGWDILEIAKSRKLLRYTISSCFVMFAIQLYYYGGQLGIQKVGLNIYLNQLIVGICEFATLILCTLIIPKLNKYKSIIFLNFISVLLCLSYQIINDLIAQSILIGILRVFTMLQLGIFQTEIPVVYTTSSRSAGLGIIYGLGNLGSVLAPYIIDLADGFGLNQIALLGIFGTVGLGFSIFLKK